MPPPATFDLVESFARRRGAHVEIVLADPKAEIADLSAAVRLRQGPRAVQALGELTESPTGRRLTIRVPAGELRNGVWTLELHDGTEVSQKLAARLLVQGQRPVVLLWGAKGTGSQLPPVRSTRTAKQHIAETGSRVLDRALSVLPEDRARAVRAQVRTRARRILR
jgi:hypothetical protein